MVSHDSLLVTLVKTRRSCPDAYAANDTHIVNSNPRPKSCYQPLIWKPAQ